jgi:tRNA (guanine-N7-)-methyltransferase
MSSIIEFESRPVSSPQSGLHDGLNALLTRHLTHPFQKPIAAYNRAAFNMVHVAWREAGKPPLVLDSGCGVGLSTLHLAERYPEHLVVGVDQSLDRIGRNTVWSRPTPTNSLRIRADLTDFWRLMLEAEMLPARHYLLYPNPWPKKKHLARRWHGHAVFPAMVALGGYFECRSNWKIYTDECALALTRLTGKSVEVEEWEPDTASTITPFERKYLGSGQALWRCALEIGTEPG